MKSQSNNLSPSFEHRLSGYALAASAAGVSLFASAQPADAKIVYTPTHVVISPYDVHTYDLDLNRQGKADFVLQSKFYSTTNQSAGSQVMIASGVEGNGLESYARPLRAGQTVGSSDKFARRGVMAVAFQSAGGNTQLHGPWVGVRNHYLGLQFKIKGQVHYGWARLSVKVNHELFYLQATLTGYAYESVPNKSIVTGKTKGPDVVTVRDASLGHLARGASAIPAWRRKEQ